MCGANISHASPRVFFEEGNQVAPAELFFFYYYYFFYPKYLFLFAPVVVERRSQVEQLGLEGRPF